jgi:hypothetical protein
MRAIMTAWRQRTLLRSEGPTALVATHNFELAARMDQTRWCGGLWKFDHFLFLYSD